MKAISGTVRECFADYAKQHLPPKNAKNASVAKKPVATFCGVSTKTIQRWIIEDSEPLGIQHIKLMFFLEAKGYRVTELQELRERAKDSYKLAEMLAYDILTLDGAQKLLDYTNSQSVYQVAFGKSGVLDFRAEVIRLTHQESLPVIKAKQEALEMMLTKKGEPEAIKDHPVVEPATEKKQEDQPLRGDVVTLAHLIQAITPLLEEFLENSDREARHKLRSLAGSEGMFRLSKVSTRLCSERAREIA